MAVLLNNLNGNDHAVGLVAVSSWQGWLRHTPRQSDIEQPGYGVSNLTRFFSTFTWSSPKAAFGYTKNGHTAMISREAGQITHVVGFNPDSFLLAGILQIIQGNNIVVQGLWYDDEAMVNDPTAVSYEINVTRPQAQAFGNLIAGLVDRSDLGPNSPPNTNYYYSFRPAVTEPRTDGIVGNCGNMALLILCQYLQEIGQTRYVNMLVEWVNQNQNTLNFGQGPMMGSITSGFSR
jgi:hypothetical protein